MRSSAHANPQRRHAEPQQWPINTYWQDSEKRISQHWYTSFCLMMSALQDYLTGTYLKEKDNLNWATTCFYYSLVHTGRLFAFCIMGYFPTRHIDLRDLYQNQPVQLDWFNEFIESGIRRRNLMWIEPNNFLLRVAELLNASDGMRNAPEQIRFFSDQLSSLAQLRTDANYESLIIAHEKYHIFVTEEFWKLSDAAQIAASKAVELAIKAYKAYVISRPLLIDRRDAFMAISNEYVNFTLKDHLQEKIVGSEEAEKELLEFCDRLLFSIGDTKKYSKETLGIEKEISMATFDEKTSLMNKFYEKVERFRTLMEQQFE